MNSVKKRDQIVFFSLFWVHEPVETNFWQNNIIETFQVGTSARYNTLHDLSVVLSKGSGSVEEHAKS